MQTTLKFNPWEVAEIELSYKSKVNPALRPKISTSGDAVAILRENWASSQMELREQFKVILLNRQSRAIGIVEISSGGVSSCIADPALIFAAAITGRASGIILAHNHPSGNKLPSREDIALTEKMVKGGKLLNIQVMDHVILTKDSYYSFVDEKMIMEFNGV